MEGLKEGGLALMINPQWQGGNLVNDFGVGPWRRRSEDFVASFQEVYILKQMRISGDNVRSVQQRTSLQAYVHDKHRENVEFLCKCLRTLGRKVVYDTLDHLMN